MTKDKVFASAWAGAVTYRKMIDQNLRRFEDSFSDDESIRVVQAARSLLDTRTLTDAARQVAESSKSEQEIHQDFLKHVSTYVCCHCLNHKDVMGVSLVPSNPKVLAPLCGPCTYHFMETQSLPSRGTPVILDNSLRGENARLQSRVSLLEAAARCLSDWLAK